MQVMREWLVIAAYAIAAVALVLVLAEYGFITATRAYVDEAIEERCKCQ